LEWISISVNCCTWYLYDCDLLSSWATPSGTAVYIRQIFFHFLFPWNESVVREIRRRPRLHGARESPARFPWQDGRIHATWYCFDWYTPASRIPSQGKTKLESDGEDGTENEEGNYLATCPRGTKRTNAPRPSCHMKRHCEKEHLGKHFDFFLYWTWFVGWSKGSNY